MANLPIENLGLRGLSTDKKPFELDVEEWSDCRNVRFNAKGAQKAKGHTLVYNVTMLHAPYWLFPWRASTGFSWLYAGLARVASIVGSAHTDVTRFTTVLGDDDYNATVNTLWSGTLLGDLPILTNDTGIDVPQQWNAGNGRFENLANWQAGHFADIMLSYKNFAVALRVKKNAVAFNPRMVKWSEPADPGTYPNSWDETDPTKLTGEVTLADTEGEIITGLKFGRAMLIYKTDSVIIMSHTQGQAVMAFDTLFTEFGALARHCVASVKKGHLVVTKGDVILHNGQTYESVIADRNRERLFSTMSASLAWKTQVKVFEQLKEVWIGYADNNSLGQLNQVLIWNYRDNTWSHEDLLEFAFIEAGFIDTTTVSLAFNDQSGSFDTDLGAFDAQAAAPVFDSLMAADPGNTKLFALNDSEQHEGVDFVSSVERTGLAMVGRDRQGNWKVDMDSTKFVRRVYPKMVSTIPVNFYVGGQEVLDGPVAWEGPFVFDPNVDKYFDPTVNTPFFGIKMDSLGNGSWSLFGYNLDLDVIGGG